MDALYHANGKNTKHGNRNLKMRSNEFVILGLNVTFWHDESEQHYVSNGLGYLLNCFDN